MYPLFLNLNDRFCVVIGGGPVGRRKAAGLIAADPAFAWYVGSLPAWHPIAWNGGKKPTGPNTWPVLALFLRGNTGGQSPGRRRCPG